MAQKEKKEEEQIAEKFMESIGFKNLNFEPNNKDTFPDFTINTNHSVEVRRLNKNISEKGIETIRHPFLDKLETELNKTYNEFDFSIKLSIQFQFYSKRDKHYMKKLISNIIKNIENELFETGIIYDEQVKYTLRKDEKQSSFLQITTYNDRNNSNEDLVKTIYDSLVFSIKEKEGKKDNSKNKYITNWLILVNDISSRMGKELERDLKMRFDKISSSFDRIIIFSKIDFNEYWDVLE